MCLGRSALIERLSPPRTRRHAVLKTLPDLSADDVAKLSLGNSAARE